MAGQASGERQLSPAFHNVPTYPHPLQPSQLNQLNQLSLPANTRLSTPRFQTKPNLLALYLFVTHRAQGKLSAQVGTEEARFV